MKVILTYLLRSIDFHVLIATAIGAILAFGYLNWPWAEIAAFLVGLGWVFASVFNMVVNRRAQAVQVTTKMEIVLDGVVNLILVVILVAAFSGLRTIFETVRAP